MADFQKASQKAQEFKQREEEILRCALKLFLEKGEEKVTVEMIADEVGIGKGTIYKHFESKHEIYLRLMIRYEEELAEMFLSLGAHDDKDRLVREYYKFRMEDPDRYALFDRLEAKCLADKAVPLLLEELHRIRASNFEKLEEMVKMRIAEGKLADVPPYFHICAAYALVHGAVALYHSDFYNQIVKDRDGFFDFLMEVAVRMGNKSRVPKANEGEDGNPLPDSGSEGSA